MKRISYVVPAVYHPNRLFDINYPEISRDNSLAQGIALKERLKTYGIDLSTQDVNPVKEADLVLFDSMPDVNDKDFKDALRYNKTRYLWIAELGFIHKGNYDARRYADFKKVFTYQDELVDHIKYFKFNYTYARPNAIPKDISRKEKMGVSYM